MLTRLITLKEGEVLLVSGPASILLQEGRASILASPLLQGKRIVVRAHKVLPVEVEEGRAQLLLTLGKGDEQLVVAAGKERVGVAPWKEACESLLSSIGGEGDLLILGATDSGKSTMATYLLNLSVSRGFQVGIVDGDVGQGDIAPPGSIGYSVVKEPLVDLRDIMGDGFRFLGVISPRMVEMEVQQAILEARERLIERGCHLRIINTDGYVSSFGLDYKLGLLEALKPTATLILGEEGWCEELIVRMEGRGRGLGRLIRVPSPQGLRKGSEARSWRRASQYRRFLRGLRPLSAPLKELKPFFLGKGYRRVLMAQLRLLPSDERNVVCFLSEPVGLLLDRAMSRLVVGSDATRGMFVGLGRGGEIVGFGIIQCLEDGEVRIASTVKDFDEVHLSRIRLLEGSEVLSSFTTWPGSRVLKGLDEER